MANKPRPRRASTDALAGHPTRSLPSLVSHSRRASVPAASIFAVAATATAPSGAHSTSPPQQQKRHRPRNSDGDDDTRVGGADASAVENDPPMLSSLMAMLKDSDLSGRRRRRRHGESQLTWPETDKKPAKTRAPLLVPFAPSPLALKTIAAASSDATSPTSQRRIIGEPTSPSALSPQPVATLDKDVELFNAQIEATVKMFSAWNDTQKNVLLSKLFQRCRMPQIHFLSSLFTLSGYPTTGLDIVQCLPHEIAIKIMSYLDPRTLCRCAQVCQAWRRLADDHRTWRDIVDQECYWRISADEWRAMEDKSVRGDRALWKIFYAQHHRIKRNWMTGRYSVRTFEGHTAHITCVQFDESRMVSASSDKTLRVWDLRTNTQCLRTLVGHAGTVRCLQFDKDKVVSGANDCSIRVWNINTGECTAILLGHTAAVRCLQMARSTLISGSYDSSIKVWDLDSRTCVRTLPGHSGAVLCVQFDEDKLVSGSADTTIKIWNWHSGECLRTLTGHNDAVTCLQYDHYKIISGSLDSSLKFWNLNSGQCVETLDWVHSEGHKGVIRNLKFDSWLMISAADDKTLKVWNVQTGQRILTLQKHTAGVTCLQFSFSKIVSGSYDKTIKLLDFAV